MNSKRAAFLFGSGISYATGLPRVSDITKGLLEKPWKSHTNWRFYPCAVEDGKASLGVAKTAQQFLRILNDNIEDQLLAKEFRETDYEDLYAAARQIVLHEMGEQTNPLIEDAVVRIKNAAAHLWANVSRAHISGNRFASLVDRSTGLIQWVVYHSLAKHGSIIGLDALPQVASIVKQLDIFTLNHDLLIEQFLDQEKISFVDGFGKANGDLIAFDWSWNDENQKNCVLKLHGSINWYLYDFETYRQYAKMTKSADFARDQNGNILPPLGSTPMFLTGTNVKEREYGTGLIGEIFYEFRKRLSMHATLICSGYGWNDKGINTRIDQWLNDRIENKVVILHANPESEIHSKGFWYWRWERYLKAGKVIIIPKWLSDCSIKDLEPFFDETN